MPGPGGIAAAREIARAAPEAAVVMLTMFDDDDSVFAAMRAGARGYLLKGAQQEEIVRAIRAAAAGEAIFGPQNRPAGVRHFRRLRRRSAAVPLAHRTRTGGARPGRRRDAQRDIAHELSITPKTVANHVSDIFAKLQVADRGEAIIVARDAGLGRNERP